MKTKKRFVPPNKFHFTKDELEFIAVEYESHTNRELFKLFNDRRKQKVGFTTFRTVCRYMGLQHTKSPFRWTQEQVKFLQHNYDKYGDTELAEKLNACRKPGQEFNRKNVHKKRMKLKLRRSPEQITKIIYRNIANGRYNTSWASWETRKEEQAPVTIPAGTKTVMLNGKTWVHLKESNEQNFMKKYKQATKI